MIFGAKFKEPMCNVMFTINNEMMRVAFKSVMFNLQNKVAALVNSLVMPLGVKSVTAAIVILYAVIVIYAASFNSANFAFHKITYMIVKF